MDPAMAIATGRVERLTLRLAVSVAGRDPAPVELDAPGDTTVGAVVEALAHAVGVEAEEIVLGRTGRRLPREAQLGDVALRHGDRLFLTGSHDGGRQRPRSMAPAPLELAVVGGPDAGRSFSLTPGDHVVGRDEGCAVRLDDPALSNRHLRLRVSDDGTVTVADLGSRNGTQLEGAALMSEASERAPLGAVISAGRSQLMAVQPATDGHPPPVAAVAMKKYNRPPRVQRRLEAAVRPFPPPPDGAQRARLPLGASLIPLALGLGLYLATRIPTMLFFAALSPLMALSTFLEDRRSGRKGFEAGRREYRQRLAALRDELEEERGRELAARRAAAPDAVQLVRRATRLEPALWERRPGDADFLSLRLGAADRPSLYAVRIDQGGDAALRKEAEEVAEWYATAPAVPVELPLGELGTAGICGPDDRGDAPERALVADLLGRAAEADVAVLWLGRRRRDLPGECAAIVELDSGTSRLAYTETRTGETVDDVSADGLARDLADELALALAPVRDTSARAGGGVPERVTLLELLGPDDVGAAWIGAHWDERSEGFGAVVGAGMQGPFSVDLRADGPHALVAGMTGSGKSELLQTLIASLAARHPPTRLSFLLVDYKGGAAFKDCTALPHTVGLVTDLDAHLTQRALVSLNAELQARERLLRDAGAKDLADMERRDPDAASAFTWCSPRSVPAGWSARTSAPIRICASRYVSTRRPRART